MFVFAICNGSVTRFSIPEASPSVFVIATFSAPIHLHGMQEISGVGYMKEHGWTACVVCLPRLHQPADTCWVPAGARRCVRHRGGTEGWAWTLASGCSSPAGSEGKQGSITFPCLRCQHCEAQGSVGPQRRTARLRPGAAKGSPRGNREV